MLTIPLIIVGLVALGCWFIHFSPMAQARHARHEVAWAGWTDLGADGLSRLQRESREWLMQFATEHGLQLSQRMEGETEPWILTEIPEIGAIVWICRDQIDLETPHRHWRWEYWDAECPAQMQNWLADELAALALPSRDSSLRGTAESRPRPS